MLILYSHDTYLFVGYLDTRFVCRAPQCPYGCARQVHLFFLSNTVSLRVCQLAPTPSLPAARSTGYGPCALRLLGRRSLTFRIVSSPLRIFPPTRVDRCALVRMSPEARAGA